VFSVFKFLIHCSVPSFFLPIRHYKSILKCVCPPVSICLYLNSHLCQPVCLSVFCLYSTFSCVCPCLKTAVYPSLSCCVCSCLSVCLTRTLFPAFLVCLHSCAALQPWWLSHHSRRGNLGCSTLKNLHILFYEI
jgi:hypothetical protein